MSTYHKLVDIVKFLGKLVITYFDGKFIIKS